jgi:hypothetical protein
MAPRILEIIPAKGVFLKSKSHGGVYSFKLSSWLQLNIKRGMGILPVHRLEACSTI